MTPNIDKIDKLNDIMGGLKAQVGAIAMFVNPDSRTDSDLLDISDFFYCMRNQLHDAMELIRELTERPN